MGEVNAINSTSPAVSQANVSAAPQQAQTPQPAQGAPANDSVQISDSARNAQQSAQGTSAAQETFDSLS